MPLTAMDCGLPVPVLVTVNVPLREPAAAGVNVTLKVQPPPAVTIVQFDPLTANSLPVLLVIALTVTAAPPTLLIVTVCGEPVMPTVVAAIVTLDGIDSWPAGGTVVAPAPESAIG